VDTLLGDQCRRLKNEFNICHWRKRGYLLLPGLFILPLVINQNRIFLRDIGNGRKQRYLITKDKSTKTSKPGVFAMEMFFRRKSTEQAG